MSHISRPAYVKSDDELLTVADIAVESKVSDRTVRRWIADEKLKVIRIGRLIRIRRKDFKSLLDQNL